MSETDPNYEPIVNIKEEKWEKNNINHQDMEIKVENQRREICSVFVRKETDQKV